MAGVGTLLRTARYLKALQLPGLRCMLDLFPSLPLRLQVD